MIITIQIDVDVQHSGFQDADELKDSLVDFTKNLLINGAENEEIAFSLLSVGYELEQ